MERRVMGRSGVRVPVIGQGTWQLERDDRKRAIAALRAGLDAGLVHIDTAEMYGSGEVERMVAEAIRGRRDEVFLASKVLPSNATHAGTRRACEQSLKRLGTDRLDLYLLHWPGDHPLEETLSAFEDLEREGKIRGWGVSNFDVPDLEQALRVAGPGRIVCNQVLYHLKERAIEHAVLPWCEQNGVGVVAYSPLGSGDFPQARSRGGAVLEGIARAHGVTPHQVALSFLTRRPSTFAIPKTAHAERATANAQAGALRLSESEAAQLDAVFPAGKPRPLPTL